MHSDITQNVILEILLIKACGRFATKRYKKHNQEL